MRSVWKKKGQADTSRHSQDEVVRMEELLARKDQKENLREGMEEEEKVKKKRKR